MFSQIPFAFVALVVLQNEIEKIFNKIEKKENKIPQNVME